METLEGFSSLSAVSLRRAHPGQDGMVANTLKYLTGQPLVGVNPSPQRWDGVLLPFQARDLPAVAPEILRGARPRKEVTMACARLNDGQSLLAVNDLFIGQRSHVSARYQLSLGGASETQSSSGVIVSTGLGSTGWFKSVLAGASGVVQAASEGVVQIPVQGQFPWDVGQVTPEQPLRISSRMPENGVIFTDGIESDFLEFNAGMEARIELAERRGLLVA